VYERRPMVLVAGIGRGPFEGLAPVLDRQKFEVFRVATPEHSIELARSEKIALVILDAEPKTMPLDEIVREIRAETSASSATSLLVLAAPGKADEPRELIGRGVNRVMLHGDPPELIGQQVAALLDIAPRSTFRYPTRLLIEVADGSEDALGAVINISKSGMLVETETEFEPGQHVVVSINLENEKEPVTAKAEVVRHAHSERDGVEGISVRFLSFVGDGRDRLEAELEATSDATSL